MPPFVADWVIEDLARKKQIVAQVETLIALGALITSSSGSLPAASIFSDLKHRGRGTVAHFFAPAWRNPVVEVVRAADADPQIVEYLRWLFCMTGKVPLTTADVECFILDRGFNNWCHEAAHCLERTSAAQIDHVAAQFVEPAPFFALSAGNGSSVISKANQILAAAKGEQYRPAAVAAPNAQTRPVQLDPSPQMTRPPRPSWSPQRTVEGTRHGRVDK